MDVTGKFCPALLGAVERGLMTAPFLWAARQPPGGSLVHPGLDRLAEPGWKS